MADAARMAACDIEDGDLARYAYWIKQINRHQAIRGILFDAKQRISAVNATSSV